MVTEGPPVLEQHELNTIVSDRLQNPTDLGSKIDVPGLAVLSPDKGAVALSGNGGTGFGPARGSAGRSVGIGDGSKPGLGTGKTSFFGLEAEGSKFVYVFDHSESMGYAVYSAESNNEFGGVPLRAAKAELLASLDELSSRQQFNIVFYNHQSMLFRPTTNGAKMVFASPEDLRGAILYLRNAGCRWHASRAGIGRSDSIETRCDLFANRRRRKR